MKNLNQAQWLTALFFLSAVALYFLVVGTRYISAFHLPQALIAPIMALGSFVAGSTFLGGGAVAFPALTKILNVDPNTAKTFSLAIQSVGMSSASLYILLRVRIIPWIFIRYYLPGAVLGILTALGFVDQWLAPNDLRLGFTLFILVFLLVYLWAFTNKGKHYDDLGPLRRLDKQLIIKTGFIGGLLSGCLGSGADLVGFCLLALYFRLDLKLATQTSVIIMALVSIVGSVFQGFVFNDINAQVTQLWLLAAPVVMLGAPVGAIFCRRATTRSLLIFISAIVACEFISTLLLVPITTAHVPIYLALTGIALLLLVMLYRISKRKTHDEQHEFKVAK